jgi:hypothetical protein
MRVKQTPAMAPATMSLIPMEKAVELPTSAVGLEFVLSTVVTS